MGKKLGKTHLEQSIKYPNLYFFLLNCTTTSRREGWKKKSACEEVNGEPTKRTFLHYISTYLVVVLTTYKCCLKPPFRCFQTHYLMWLQSFAAKCSKNYLYYLHISNNLRKFNYNFLREKKKFLTLHHPMINWTFLLIFSPWDCRLQLSKSLLDNAPSNWVLYQKEK